MSSTAPQTDFSDKLASIQAKFKERLPETFETLTVAFAQWDENPRSVQAIQNLLGNIHKLAGSAGTLGFDEVHQLASEAEQAMMALKDSPDIKRTEMAQTARLPVQKLLAIDTGTCVPRKLPASLSGEAPQEIGLKREKLVFVSPDNPETHELRESLDQYGFNVVFANQDELVRSTLPVPSRMPLVIDRDSITLDDAEIKDITAKYPVFFMSSDGSFSQRLEAVRLGGKAFFQKPIIASDLLDKIDHILPDTEKSPYRIMLVDDDPAILEFIQTLLVSCGMTVQTVSDPLKALEVFHTFSPELVITDQHMPACTGTELAHVFRQISEYTALPIIFLSSDNSIKTRLGAFSEGADDFLSKDTEPQILIQSITHRAERFRQLRSLLMRDGLTNLFNHTSLQQQLDLEILRARRSGSALSFVLLDIDHFKSVNDRYGHPVGDMVIKNLARILQRSVRSTDLIGRVGGEEFGIIMPGARAEDILPAVDRIRSNFSELNHQADDATFQVTFSCGISEFPSNPCATTLIKSADNAMYKAKHAGRNQIKLA